LLPFVQLQISWPSTSKAPKSALPFLNLRNTTIPVRVADAPAHYAASPRLYFQFIGSYFTFRTSVAVLA
jgi:hypothetical protein